MVGKRAFVVMPFDRAFDCLHREAIRPALDVSGYLAERFDDAPRTGTVLGEICRGIETADLVIAVVAGKNPHVFFEIGLAIAQHKPCVLLARSADEVPCFLERLPRVVYDGNVAEARMRLAACLSTLESRGGVASSITGASLAVHAAVE